MIHTIETIKIIKENQSKKKFDKICKVKIKKYDEPVSVAVKKDKCKLNVSISECVLAYKIPFKNNYESLIYTLTLSSIFIKINSFILQKVKFIINVISKIFKIPIKTTIKIVKKLINFKNKKGNLKSNDE